MKMQTSQARLYVGTYQKYNSGSIEGKWIDLEDYTDKDAFLAACAALHSDESDPEFMFQDFEGIPRRLYSEGCVDDAIWEWLALDESDRELLEAYLEATSAGPEHTIDDARDAFAGIHSSGADFAADIAEETGAVPKDFPSWISIDWESTWECNLRFDYSTHRDDNSGNLYFFRNC